REPPREDGAVEQADERPERRPEPGERVAVRPPTGGDVQRPVQGGPERTRRPRGVVDQERQRAERKGPACPQRRATVESPANAGVVDEQRREEHGGEDPEEVRLVVDAEAERERAEAQRAQAPAPPPVGEGEQS